METEPPAQKGLRVEEATEEEGVREGRLPAAPPVAGRARIGPGALRPDLEDAGVVEPCDRSAPGADRGHADRRHHDGEVADDLVRRVGRLAVADERDVRAGAAHVQGDEVAVAGLTADVAGADDARGRAREERLYRGVTRVAGRGHAAIRLRDVERGADAGAGETAF